MDKITHGEINFIFTLDDYFDEEVWIFSLIALFKDGKFVIVERVISDYSSYATCLKKVDLKSISFVIFFLNY
jgi:hypothetical protein